MKRVVGTVVALTAAVAVAGCSDPVTPSQSVLVDEVAAHGGEVCPERLPLGEDPAGYGFGTEEPADATPALLALDSAWVCRYVATRVGPGPGGDGSTYRWSREGESEPVETARLAAIRQALDELQPQEAQFCPDDLGPRWMLVYAHRNDLTGVVVDDYGCGNVRLTDEPFKTAPGDPGQVGTVPGVLSAPTGLLSNIKAAAEH